MRAFKARSSRDRTVFYLGALATLAYMLTGLGCGASSDLGEGPQGGSKFAYSVAIPHGAARLNSAGSEGISEAEDSADYLMETNPQGAPESDPPTFVVPFEDLEATGPYPSWVVATEYGAIGDGVADDTAALQALLDRLTLPNQPAVLYLPRGTYRITRSLTLAGTTNAIGISIVGESPGVTSIVWDGERGLPMFVANGGLFTLFSRITWDGRSKAGIGVAHWWNTTFPMYGGSAEHVDEVFVDMEIGIQAGRMGAVYGQLDSEGTVRRVKFLRNTKAGFNVGSFNALNWWIWDSIFENCARGVSNIFTLTDSGEDRGAGNFSIYRSAFKGSSIADVNIANTGWFGVYNSISEGSRRFFQSEGMGNNVAAQILQGNVVVDTTDPIAVYTGNLGPVTLIDNKFRTQDQYVGPVVKLGGWASGREGISIGNSYTVPNAIEPSDGSDRVLSIGDRLVTRSAIPIPHWPRISAPARSARLVFEVPSGASASVIQTAIERATEAASGGAYNPIVHLPAGSYQIDKSIRVPSQTRIQIVGDSAKTILWWAGGESGEPMILLEGPSKVTLRDFRVVGQTEAIRINGADQSGSRILIVGSSMGPISIDGIKKGRVAMQATSSATSIDLSHAASVVSMGAGVVGPVTMSQSNLVMSDTWYEGREARLFRVKSGNLTYRGGHLTPADRAHGGGAAEPFLLLDEFNGQATFIGAILDLPTPQNGIRIANEVEATKLLLIGLESNISAFLERDTQGNGQIGLVSSRYPAETGEAEVVSPNVGTVEDSFILDGLRQIRTVVWEAGPNPTDSEISDVKLYRLMTLDAKKGLKVEGGR